MLCLFSNILVSPTGRKVTTSLGGGEGYSNSNLWQKIVKKEKGKVTSLTTIELSVFKEETIYV